MSAMLGSDLAGSSICIVGPDRCTLALPTLPAQSQLQQSGRLQHEACQQPAGADRNATGRSLDKWAARDSSIAPS